MEWLSQHTQEAFGHEFGTRRKGKSLGQYDELVATQSSHGVRLSKSARESRSHGLEQDVTLPVAQSVIDIFETIEIDEEDGNVRSLSPSPRESLIHSIEKQRAVG